jgi:hypothetical protein
MENTKSTDNDDELYIKIKPKQLNDDYFASSTSESKINKSFLYYFRNLRVKNY